MDSISTATLLVDDPYGEGPRERAPRTNLLLSATIEAGALKAAVRIRNLSETGALLEGPAFPGIGEPLTLGRAELSIGASVVWRTGSRCGVKFDGVACVSEWVAGKHLPAGGKRDQAYIDRVQAAIRAGETMGVEAVAAVKTGAAPVAELDRRLAEELSYVRRLLETAGDELTDEPIVVQRHMRTLQGFDVACQILGHISAILSAGDRGAAVDAVGMADLRARLMRKAIF